MTRFWCTLLWLGLSACVGDRVVKPRVPPVHAFRTSGACVAARDQVRCAGLVVPLAAYGVLMPLRAWAPRMLGGLWLVDREGVLRRLDARGVLTGKRADGDVGQVVTRGRLVCVRTTTGQVECAVDRHDDRGCTGNDALISFRALAGGFGAITLVAPDLVCDVARRPSPCVRIEQPCERACLRFPSCHAALRCLDVCAPGQAALLAHPVANFSGAAFISEPPSSDS